MAALKGARCRERFGWVNLPAVLSRAWLASCHAELGMFAEGRAHGEEGLRIAEAVAHHASLVFASWGVGLLALRQGDLHRALPRLERAIGICHEEVTLHVEGQATQRSVLDALEARYPMLRGAIRDQVTQQRRAFVRFFACEQDLSHELPDAPLPDAVALGAEPFLIVGAMAGG
jgi:hypothetical protein